MRKAVSKDVFILYFYFKESLFIMCNNIADYSLMYYSYLVISNKPFENNYYLHTKKPRALLIQQFIFFSLACYTKSYKLL